MSDSLKEFDAAQNEKTEYWNMNIQPCIKLFLHNDVNDKGWTYCDMLFTDNYKTIMRLYRSHDLCMQHMQTWYRSLMRDEGRDDSQLLNWSFDVPPRVRDAEKILMEFENDRLDGSAPLYINKQIYQESCHKPHNLFCVCLDDIVRRHSILRQNVAEWDEYVVQGWFDYYNNENARVFIARAELFLKKYGKRALQHYMDSSTARLAACSSWSVSRCSNPYTVA